MGSYVSLKFDGISIAEWKAPYHGSALELFSTRHVVRETRRHQENYDGEIEEWEEEYVGLQIEASSMRRRMDALGYTLDICTSALHSYIEADWERLRSYDFIDQSSLCTADEAKEALRIAINSIIKKDLNKEEATTLLSEIESESILDEDNTRHLISAISDYVEFMPILRHLVEGKDGIVELDLTDIYAGGWISDEEINEIGQKIENQFLILTEGSSDRDIIKAALDHYEPDMADLFYFPDVDLSIPQTGAARINELLKAFVSLKITNRVIAIFDNDAEGYYAFQNALEYSSGCKNIKPMILPDLDEFSAISCEGPDGLHITNVNGRAASIELYLDRPLSRGKAEVKWSAYLKSCERWQGEPIEKRNIMLTFFSQHKNPTYNSSGIRQILSAVFNAASQIGQKSAEEFLFLEEDA